jgi:predicted amidohydrolase YtcJ
VNRPRLATACLAACLVVISAPWSQLMLEYIAAAWPAQFRTIGIATTAVPVAIALAVAVGRIRARRPLRYALLALALGAGGAYITLAGVGFAESFHFVEYGAIAVLFYRACRPLGGVAAVVLPLLAGVVVGVCDEWFQWFIPIRTGELRDVLLNAVAVGCGLMLAVAVEPPGGTRASVNRRSRRLIAVAATVTTVVFGLFAETLRAGHEIRDREAGAFASRFSEADLEAASRDRAARWRAAPPLTVSRLSREDQYLAEGLAHARARNAAWSAGDIAAAWRENRILERFYQPVLDMPTYASARGNRWPDAQRADAAARAGGADLIIRNARIYTLDARQPIAEAIAVSGARIVRVDDDAEVMALRGAGTRVIDAGQATIVPGFHDAHGHVLALGTNLQNLDLRGTTSYRHIVDLVRRRAASARPGEWIVGQNWDQNDWASKDWPTHDALSAVTPANPVFLARVDGHAALVNAAAMALAGLTAGTRDPDGGRILRTAGGQPTGVLIDRAQGLVEASIPPLTASQLETAVLLADREMRRLGLTTVGDAGADAATIDAYTRLIDRGMLKTRLYVMVSGGSLARVAPFFARGPLVDYGNHRMAVRALKLYADGALGSRGAAMLEPYSDEPSTSGLLTTPPDEIYAETLAASKAGFQTAIHAIGDRGNRIALDIFERVQREVPGARALRMRIEHAQILDAADLPRFAALGVIASMQPTHATSDMPWAAARIGRARIDEGAYAWQSLLASGAILASGSDFPVEEPNPLLGFYAAVTRQDRAGNPPGGWTPGQRLSREQALRSFTLDAAYAAHAESLTGSLETGKLADLVMLSRDIMRVPPSEIPATTVRMTLVGGEIVYAAP